MNKYQEALDMISSHLFNDEPHHEFDLIESVETLKELVLENEYLKACLNEAIMNLQAIEGLDKSN